MKKRMLEKYTSRYDKVPSWLMIMLSCFIAFGYVLIGGFLAGIAVGIPLFIVFAFLMLNGNIQLQDVNTISFNLFSTLYCSIIVGNSCGYRERIKYHFGCNLKYIRISSLIIIPLFLLRFLIIFHNKSTH